jgi:hypothetical protein
MIQSYTTVPSVRLGSTKHHAYHSSEPAYHLGIYLFTVKRLWLIIGEKGGWYRLQGGGRGMTFIRYKKSVTVGGCSTSLPLCCSAGWYWWSEAAYILNDIYTRGKGLKQLIPVDCLRHTYSFFLSLCIGSYNSPAHRITEDLL